MATMATKKEEPRGYVAWFCTTNANDDESEEHFKGRLQPLLDKAKKYKAVLERGHETGHLHAHFVLEFKNQVRMSSIIKAVGPGTYEKLDRESWADYIYKTGKHADKADTQLCEPWGTWYVPTPVYDVIVAKGALPWQASLETELLEKPNDRRIIWIADLEGGMGKTQFAKHMVLKYPSWTFVQGAKSADIAHVVREYIKPEKGEKKLLQGLLFLYSRAVDARVCNYTMMEAAKDGMMFASKYASTPLTYDPIHVVVLANTLPLVDTMTKDKWDIRTPEREGDVIHLGRYKQYAPIFSSHSSQR